MLHLIGEISVAILVIGLVWMAIATPIAFIHDYFYRKKRAK